MPGLDNGWIISNKKADYQSISIINTNRQLLPLCASARMKIDHKRAWRARNTGGLEINKARSGPVRSIRAACRANRRIGPYRTVAFVAHPLPAGGGSGCEAVHPAVAGGEVHGNRRGFAGACAAGDGRQGAAGQWRHHAAVRL